IDSSVPETVMRSVVCSVTVSVVWATAAPIEVRTTSAYSAATRLSIVPPSGSSRTASSVSEVRECNACALSPSAGAHTKCVLAQCLTGDRSRGLRHSGLCRLYKALTQRLLLVQWSGRAEFVEITELRGPTPWKCSAFAQATQTAREARLGARPRPKAQ